MSTPPPPPPSSPPPNGSGAQGPYGQGAPGAYGQPPQYPQYPQFPQYPQQGYPQGYPGGWGQPPMPPPVPPRRGMGPGKIVAIVAGSLAGIVVLGAVVTAITSNGGSSKSSSAAPADSSSPSAPSSPSDAPSGGPSSAPDAPSAEYRLTVPKSLAGGKYTLAKDLTSSLDDKLGPRNSGPNERGMRNAGGQYLSASGGTPTTLVFSGMYGDIADPDVAVDSMLRGVGEADGTEVTTPARTITPPGAHEPVRCQVISLKRAGASGTMPVCAWSDHSTVATVLETGGVANGGGTPDDVRALAQRAAAVRDEVRVTSP